MEGQCESVEEISKIIGVTNKQVINRAIQYLRLLKIKTAFKSKNEYPRIVICLDISSAKANGTIDFVGANVDVKLLFRFIIIYSFQDKGLKLIKYGKIKYRNEKNTILTILNINQAPNVKTVCIALKLTQSKDVEKNASQILEKLKKNKANLLGEIGHPQNACMAVYQSCKLLSVKVDERKLIDLSRLQRKQWTQLKVLWSPWLENCKILATAAEVPKQNSKKSTNAQTNGIIEK